MLKATNLQHSEVCASQTVPHISPSQSPNACLSENSLAFVQYEAIKQVIGQSVGQILVSIQCLQPVSLMLLHRYKGVEDLSLCVLHFKQQMC